MDEENRGGVKENPLPSQQVQPQKATAVSQDESSLPQQEIKVSRIKSLIFRHRQLVPFLGMGILALLIILIVLLASI